MLLKMEFHLKTSNRDEENKVFFDEDYQFYLKI